MKDLGQLKGNALREFHLWFERNYGTEHMAADAETLPEHLRKLVDPSREAYGVLASKWYPMELAHALLDQVATRFSREELDAIALRAGPEVMNAMMSGLQRRAFRLLMNPERYGKYVQTIWRQNFDSGDIEVKMPSPTEQEGRVTNWHGHHRLICRLIHAGKIAVFEAMGCEGVELELTGCIADGDPACSSRLRWQG
ncbi:MAG: hypothetical protein ACOCV4_02670 [Myxococcota bacterium]